MSVYSDILHNGLMRYKYKNSVYRDVDFQRTVKGSIFAFYSKKQMINARGVVMTSLEAVENQSTQLSHWTPNIYCYGTYANKTKKIIKGHNEQNLKQINTFYVDIDSKSISESDILLACLEWGFMPTLILNTEKGYQVYFVLKEPVYVTKQSNYRVIDVAKMISKFIRQSLLDNNIPVDLFCNHFGIARFPNDKNIIYYDSKHKYTFKEWLHWSMKQEDISLTMKHSKTMYVLSGNQSIKQIDEKWFGLLMKQAHIIGEKGTMGRNNVLFTLALACFSSGISRHDCEMSLELFNSRLKNPMSSKEYTKIIASAYSNVYSGASREYVLLLCRQWIDSTLQFSDLFVNQKWKKFKKPRQQRIRSHYSEWEVDVLTYLERCITDSPFIKTTKKVIQEAINIPKRTLDIVLDRLLQKQLIVYKSSRGKNGGIKIALIKRICLHVIEMTQKQHQEYIKHVSTVLGIEQSIVSYAVDVIMGQIFPLQHHIFDVDIGGVTG